MRVRYSQKSINAISTTLYTRKANRMMERIQDFSPELPRKTSFFVRPALPSAQNIEKIVMENGEDQKTNLSECDVFINLRSGNSLTYSTEQILYILRNSFPEIRTAVLNESAELEALLSLAAKEKTDRPILIGGGDGTIFRFIQELPEKNSRPFGIIPLGTMNLLARDLGIPEGLENALNAYRSSREDFIDMADVNGIRFVCSAAIGIIPEASRVREETRESFLLTSYTRLVQTILQEMQEERQTKLKFSLDGRWYETRTGTLIIANNGYIRNPAHPHERLQRRSLKKGKMVVYSAAPHSTRERFRLLFRLWKGNWQSDPSVWRRSAKEIIVRTGDTNPIPVSLDGEIMNLPAPLHFHILPRHLRVLLPSFHSASPNKRKHKFWI